MNFSDDCGLCGEAGNGGAPVAPWLARVIREENPSWAQGDAACESCVESLLALCAEADRLEFQ